MKAMILAAGLGTRLGEITRDLPKCLVDVGGKPIIEHVVARLKEIGVTEVVINLHYLAEKVRAFVLQRAAFGLSVQFSYEPIIQDTGGGVRDAASLLQSVDPVVIYNADVLCSQRLAPVIEAHRKSGALATLVVLRRPARRFLLFSEAGNLVGWENPDEGVAKSVPGTEKERAQGEKVGFTGIHVVEQDFFPYLRRFDGPFNIFRAYLEAASEGQKIRSFVLDQATWVDIGTPQDLELARRAFGASNSR